MTGPYSDLTDAALLEEIAAFRKAIRDTAMGGGVGVVAGEGRRLEYTSGNVSVARNELRELLAEAFDRGLPAGNVNTAIPVEIG